MSELFPKKDPFKTSLKTWIAIVLFYLLPALLDALDPHDQHFHNVLWFFYLIPTLILTFNYGAKLGAISTGAGSIIMIIVEATQPGDLVDHEFITFFELTIVNILITLVVGILVKRMKENQIQLNETRSLIESIFNNLDIGIWSMKKGQSLLKSKGIEKIYGLPREYMTNESNFWRNHIHPDYLYIADEIDKKWANKEVYEYEYRIVRPNGEIRWMKDRGIPVLDENGELLRYDGTNEDITEQKRTKAELEYIAYHDPLTGLYNMSYLNHRLKYEFLSHKQNGVHAYLMFFNLDRFKLINDSYGHQIGDQLLKAAAKKLIMLKLENEKVIRSGGDEFILYLQNSTPEHAEDTAKKLLREFAKPFYLEKLEVRLSASIGITKIQPDDSIEDAIQKASSALHFAKDNGRNQYQFYSSEFAKIANRRLLIEQGLRKALEDGKLEVFYQPKLALYSNQITGFEALLRWSDPILGRVSPDEFIPIAEETGLIIPIGKWVLEEACRQNFDWQQNGYSQMHVCVNISSKQFLQDDFVSMIEQILTESNLNPELLNLEITEGIALYNMEDTINKLLQLKNLGISVSLDDFGKGYSSLSYIKSLPINFLKIDRLFITDIFSNSQDTTIISSIITLAHSLGLQVVAEGVETHQQLSVLGEMGCDEIQGYYIAKPMAPVDFNKFLKDR